jgi:hypothetical protein
MLQANPARRVRRVPPPDKCEFIGLKKINNLVGPPPFIRSNTVEVPHPNTTRSLSVHIGIQARGVPTGKFVEIRRNLRVWPDGKSKSLLLFFQRDKNFAAIPLAAGIVFSTLRTLQHYRRLDGGTFCNFRWGERLSRHSLAKADTREPARQ